MSDSPTSKMDLKGQFAVVTGAAQGLGFAIAETLAQRGAAVVIADVQLQKAADAARTLSARGFLVEPLEMNVADSLSVENGFDCIMNTLERVDIMVNNAGVGQQVAGVVELTNEEWQRVIGVTLTGTFYCCRAAARIMERQNSGSIVNIASINGQNPAPLVAAYNVAKAGVISLTRTLALELAASGVRVNAVSPGPVYTDFNKTVMAQRCQRMNLTEEQMIERIRSSIPLGRWGQADDIAAAVAFLCSAEASWITGEVLRVSGGLEGVSAAPPRRTAT